MFLILSLFSWVCLALLFGGDTNPVHPKHIGSIDPTCNVADVVKGKEASVMLEILFRWDALGMQFC